jgi:hypothetical protein
MAWSTPLTAVSNAALTAAQWNASVRDNLLETAPAKATTAGQFFVSTAANAIAARSPQGNTLILSQTTTSTTFTDLATPGPTVTVTTGTTALVVVGAKIQQNTNSAESLASFAVSGASTIAADSAWAVSSQFPTAGTESHAMSKVTWQTGLTPGANTFTMKYRVTAGTGTFDLRSIAVIPF